MLFSSRSSRPDDDFETLLAACQAQNRRAQQRLFKQFFSYTKSICLRYCANAEEAEEVLNESFLKVFQHLGQYNPALPFKAWLRTIVVNTAISYHRKYHKLGPMAELDAGQAVAFDDSVIDLLTAEEILAQVQQLPVALRTVFSLHVVDGYSLREVADLLQQNEATVRSHFLRARQRLQQSIRHYYPHFFGNDTAGSRPARFYEN